jgi:hypothetical protein
MLPKSSLTALLLVVATIAQTCESRTFNFFAVWFKRPYKGPQCVVEVVGADLDPVSNKRFDCWSKPDILVECRHARWMRKTPIEGNTFKPRWLWQAKMPHKAKRGFGFTVYDVNVLKGNEVIGRSFISAKEANKLKATDGSKVMSLGDGIGSIKVNISKVPKQLNKKIEIMPDIKAGKGVPRIKQ